MHLFLRKLIPLLMALWLLPALLYAQRGTKQARASLEKQKEQLLKEIAEANKALQANRRSAKQNLAVQRELEQKIANRNAQINNINRELKEIEGDISSTNDNVRTLEKEVDSLRARYAELLVYAYKSRDSYDVLSFFFSANSFNDAIRRYQYLRQYRESRRRQAESLLSTRSLLSQKLADLETQRAKKATALRSEQQQRNVLVADKKETDQTIAQLKDQEKDLQQRIEANKIAAKKVDQAIQAAIRREIEEARRKAAAQALARRKAEALKRKQAEEARRKAAIAAAKKAHKPVKPLPEKKAEEPEEETPVKMTSEEALVATPEALSLAHDFEANKGRLPWPVDAGRITGHFGAGRVGKIDVDNNGIIIATAQGAPVKAIFDGEVIMVFQVPGAGYMVTLRHGKYFTNYVRLVNVQVSKGASVKRGHVLGSAAPASGGSNGEIELQVYRNMTKQNPESWIRRR
ncbi:Septal ring factor EnvC, activator of murein hydrolases AmiA and AmiB [Chitinophaga terrae (ex Kim and Jung 2007)]|uniref:Septal ring factor EnvC, activator of murein hydrolases AmiA and AmiB n=1 Tax=Chitinophaga terrae (ex Kim and Jung 2007) TaxID=408074 RepID=A0A1H3Y1I4_9BACT|nr:Septal ring factor EnvC, activator of murein hydrolases AmiA and AmiB [Chitinophaga terrae (ex Kim and Jung 2007)]